MNTQLGLDYDQTMATDWRYVVQDEYGIHLIHIAILLTNLGTYVKTLFYWRSDTFLIQ